MKQTRPYIIWAPDYISSSAGIRSLHKLCHLLNTAGLRAYVTAKITNPAWNTPRTGGFDLLELVGQGAIAVYPEIVRGNPYNASVVVRYFLNRAGVLGGGMVFDPREITFTYHAMFSPHLPDEAQLYISVIETEIFYPPPNPAAPRTTICRYIGKRRLIERNFRPPPMPGVVEITRQPDFPATRRKLGELLRTCQLLYCYDNLTALMEEARLCGCPVVLMPDLTYNREAFATQSALGIDGLAWGDSPEEIAHAKATVGRFALRYQQACAATPRQLARFIKRTQLAPPLHPPEPMASSVLFRSLKYPNLRINLGGTVVQFQNHEYQTRNIDTIRRLLDSASYGTSFLTPDAHLVVCADGSVVEATNQAIRQKYPETLVQDVSIVIGTHRNPDCIKECLQSLLLYTPRGYELIVVANDTDTLSLETLASYKKLLGKDMQLIVNQENQGFSAFNNKAVGQARGRFILYLNDDTVLSPYWLESMVYLYERAISCGAVGKKSLSPDGRPFQHAQGSQSGEEEYALGFCLLVRREDARFDEGYTVAGWEDLDLCKRLRSEGKHILIEREFPITHKGSQTVKRIPNREEVYRKNKRYFEQKWA